MMKKLVDLPISEPIYNTYQYQTPGSAVLTNNPSVYNWYINQVMILTCTKRFLNGFTSPQINILNSNWKDNPYLIKKWYGTQFLKGHVHYVIRNLLDAGYYVYFNGVDDYYVKGKSWYHKRHFSHDGCICGYDQENKTYCLYAYDENWVCKKFWTPQKAIYTGMKACFKKGIFGNICGIKPTEDAVSFSSNAALKNISLYLNPAANQQLSSTDEIVYGIFVHDYIYKYLQKLYDGSIPYQNMDHRVFRLIWEHKKAMLERIKLIEADLCLDNSISERYTSIVRESDNCRMLYASYSLKQRNSLLTTINQKLITLRSVEEKLLEELLEKSKKEAGT